MDQPPPTGGAMLSPHQLSDDRHLVLRVMPLPADVNANGDNNCRRRIDSSELLLVLTCCLT